MRPSSWTIEARPASARSGASDPGRSAPAPRSRLVAALAPISVCACIVAAALLAAAPAGADVFGPISLVSEGTFGGSEPQQAEYAHDATVSGNGMYVAFDGSVAGVTGVWRRDLATGALEEVAGGDAEMPSISESGQYVSFTTNEGRSLPAITDGRPDEAPNQEAVNVYVRNMALNPGAEGAFTVVSAPSGSTEPLEYLAAGTTLGASAAGRSAISADGNEVAFVTTAVSNLVRYPKLEEEEREEGEPGEPPVPHTPALQVAVRYLDSHTTVLVSRCYFHCEEAADEGAAEPVVGSEQLGAVYPGERLEFPSVPESGEWPGASISADGSTVAWMGEDVGEQGPTLSAETLEPLYTEPLWRRIAPGSETDTERVTGGSDPENPLCETSGESALPFTPSPSDPCQGPFAKVEGAGLVTGIWSHGPDIGDFTPRLSADGYTVAFISQAPLVSGGSGFGRGGEGQASDLYVADMQPGLTRDEALTPLTEIGAETLADSAPIADFAISPDGRQVAFTTVRTQFLLDPPAYVSEPAPEPGLPELFDVDLGNGTLTRVTHGYLGGPSEQPHQTKLYEEDQYGTSPEGFGALSPSFSADGDKLVFTSTADNLVYGDGNTPTGEEKPSTAPDNGSDAFLVERQVFDTLPAPQYVSPAPEPAAAPAWQLGVTAVSRSNGSVLLYVQAPGPGSLRARAQSAVVVDSHAARGGRRASTKNASTHHSSARRASPRATRARARRAVATRTVATRAADAKGVGLTTLTLALEPSYASLALQRGGLSATVTLTYTAPGRPVLRQSIPVTFLRQAKRSKAKRTRARSRRAGRRPSTAGGRS